MGCFGLGGRREPEPGGDLLSSGVEGSDAVKVANVIILEMIQSGRRVEELQRSESVTRRGVTAPWQNLVNRLKVMTDTMDSSIRQSDSSGTFTIQIVERAFDVTVEVGSGDEWFRLTIDDDRPLDPARGLDRDA